MVNIAHTEEVGVIGEQRAAPLKSQPRVYEFLLLLNSPASASVDLWSRSLGLEQSS